MKYLWIYTIVFLFCFLGADFLFSQSSKQGTKDMKIPFYHEIHGDSIGLDCAHCHGGVITQVHANMPSKKDCMDCHRLPLTESQGILRLDSLLEKASDDPWVYRSVLPEHVVFHHGVHFKAGVQCLDCHGKKNGKDYRQNKYGNQIYSMKMCIDCHQGKIFSEKKYKRAPVYCGACHR